MSASFTLESELIGLQKTPPFRVATAHIGRIFSICEVEACLITCHARSAVSHLQRELTAFDNTSAPLEYTQPKHDGRH